MEIFLEYIFDLSPKEGEGLSLTNLQEFLLNKLKTLSTGNIISQEFQPLLSEKPSLEEGVISKTDSFETNEELEEKCFSKNSENGIHSKAELSEMRVPAIEPEGFHTYAGRLGPEQVVLNQQDSGGNFVLRDGKLEIESHSNFSSARANVCVFSGKWMYEATLITAGIQQIGWASIDTPFTNEEGVGDSDDSFSYDGKRVKKWNLASSTYGELWTTGDVIGCCIDLDVGNIVYYRNGKSLDVAFSNVAHGSNAIGVAYFPAVSLSYGECCLLNFGSRPFVYPVTGYQPIQLPPPSSALRKVNYLLDSFRRLLLFVVRREQQKEHWQSLKEPLSQKISTVSCLAGSQVEVSEDEITLVSSHIFQHLAPFLQQDYFVRSAFYPMLESMFPSDKESDAIGVMTSSSTSGSGISQKEHWEKLIAKAMELIFVCMEDFELNTFMSLLISASGYRSRITGYHMYTSGRRMAHLDLRIAISLLRISEVRKLLIGQSSFPIILESLFVVKQLNSSELSQLFPVVWWPNADEEICSKENMDAELERVRILVSMHESLLSELCALFLLSGKEESSDSSLQFFRSFLRDLIKKNRGSNRNIVPPGLSDLTVLTHLYFVLLKFLHPHLIRCNDLYEHSNSLEEKGEILRFPSATFHSGKLPYFDASRFGGLIGYLQKAMPILDTPTTAFNVADEGLPLEVELFDDMIMFYYFGMSARFKQASIEMQALTNSLTQLEDTGKRIKRQKEQNPQVEHLILAKKVFLDDAVDRVRTCAWNRVWLFEQHKQEQMFSSVCYMVHILEFFSHFNPLFSYIPEFYLESLIDSFHALRRGDPAFPLTDTEARCKRIAFFVQFLILHFDDKRIINPDVRDLLLQSISVLLQYPDFVRTFERQDIDRQHFMKALLIAFDSRSWIQILNILLRFWKGTGFGQSSIKTNDCASIIYQHEFKELCTREFSAVNEFLNKVFNNLNWAITDFGVSIKECQSAVSKGSSPELQQAQRKCNVMFELSVNLLRVLELISFEQPSIFLCEEINLTRLSELLIYVLNRSTTGTEAKLFDSLLKLEMMALDKVSKVSILEPTAGIICSLEQPQLYSLAASIANIGGFKLDIFRYVITFDWHKALGEKYPELGKKLDILTSFVARLEEELNALTKREESDRGLSKSESGEFCTICCAVPVDTHFEPCGHRSCNRCIQRHLLNSRRCFFCNTEISHTVSDIPNPLKEKQADSPNESVSSTKASTSTENEEGGR